MALKAGLKKGGAAKGELVLAIFELANCFRHGWGITKDPVAAKQASHLVFHSSQSSYGIFGLAQAKEQTRGPRAMERS
jgi:hypothetical protein